MSALTDRIATDHRLNSSTWECSCGHKSVYTVHLLRLREQECHVAEVTEAAVRAQIAADIEVLRADAALPSPVSYRAARDDAARIAKGGA